MKKEIALGLILILGVTLVNGCISSEKKININEFREICEQTGGNFHMPLCGTPQDPNCPERESICDCITRTISYKSVMNVGWSGCK
jgi:hypothetical protein